MAPPGCHPLHGAGVVSVLAGEPPKGVLKLYTSRPVQGAMIPEGTAMKRAVDLAIAHAGGTVAGYTIEVGNLDGASPQTPQFIW